MHSVRARFPADGNGGRPGGALGGSPVSQKRHIEHPDHDRLSLRTLPRGSPGAGCRARKAAAQGSSSRERKKESAPPPPPTPPHRTPPPPLAAQGARCPAPASPSATHPAPLASPPPPPPRCRRRRCCRHPPPCCCWLCCCCRCRCWRLGGSHLLLAAAPRRRQRSPPAVRCTQRGYSARTRTAEAALGWWAAAGLGRGGAEPEGGSVKCKARGVGKGMAEWAGRHAEHARIKTKRWAIHFHHLFERKRPFHPGPQQRPRSPGPRSGAPGPPPTR